MTPACAHADLVLAIGGQPTASLATTELLSLDGIGSSWTANAPLVTGRSYFQAVQLVDGRILVAGGCAALTVPSPSDLVGHPCRESGGCPLALGSIGKGYVYRQISLILLR